MDKHQTIFKVHREERDRWTEILNETIRDSRMSFRSTGLLAYLLSLPNDWVVSQAHMATVKTDGRDSVRAAFADLIDCGYVSKELIREAGQIVGTTWHVFERPTVIGNTESGSTESGNTESGKSDTTNTVEETNKLKKRKAAASPCSTVETEIIPESLQTDEFWDAWQAWRVYRKDNGFKAYKPKGAQDQLNNLSKIGSDRAVEAIRFSMLQLYQGIFEPKGAKQEASKAKKPELAPLTGKPIRMV